MEIRADTEQMNQLTIVSMGWCKGTRTLGLLNLAIRHLYLRNDLMMFPFLRQELEFMAIPLASQFPQGYKPPHSFHFSLGRTLFFANDL